MGIIGRIVNFVKVFCHFFTLFLGEVKFQTVQYLVKLMCPGDGAERKEPENQQRKPFIGYAAEYGEENEKESRGEIYCSDKPDSDLSGNASHKSL